MIQAQRDDLVAKYGHLPRLTARRVRVPASSGLELEDLVSAGWIGLIKAAETFDPERKVLFPTYAIALIRGAILESLRQWDPIPRTQREKARRENRDLPVSFSLERSRFGQNQTLRLADFLKDPSLGPAEEAEQQDVIRHLRRAVDRLPERERIVISLYYHSEMTLKMIAAVLEISESRAYQLRNQALIRLQKDLQPLELA